MIPNQLATTNFLAEYLRKKNSEKKLSQYAFLEENDHEFVPKINFLTPNKARISAINILNTKIYGTRYKAFTILKGYFPYLKKEKSAREAFKKIEGLSHNLVEEISKVVSRKEPYGNALIMKALNTQLEKDCYLDKPKNVGEYYELIQRKN